MTLSPTFPLAPSQQRRMESRTAETSLEGLREWTRDPRLGEAARTALRCVEERDADPRLMLLIIEKADEGHFDPVPRTHARTPNGQIAPKRGEE